MALTQALQIHTMYVSQKNCINVTFSFNKKKEAEVALLDSSATDNFIDQKCYNFSLFLTPTHDQTDPCTPIDR